MTKKIRNRNRLSYRSGQISLFFDMRIAGPTGVENRICKNPPGLKTQPYTVMWFFFISRSDSSYGAIARYSDSPKSAGAFPHKWFFFLRLNPNHTPCVVCHRILGSISKAKAQQGAQEALYRKGRPPFSLVDPQACKKRMAHPTGYRRPGAILFFFFFFFS